MKTHYFRFQPSLLPIFLTALTFGSPALALQVNIKSTGQHTASGAEIVTEQFVTPTKTKNGGYQGKVLRIGVRQADGSIEWDSYVALADGKTVRGPKIQKSPVEDITGFTPEPSGPILTKRVDRLNRPIYVVHVWGPTTEDPGAGGYIEGIMSKATMFRPSRFIAFKARPEILNLMAARPIIKEGADGKVRLMTPEEIQAGSLPLNRVPVPVKQTPSTPGVVDPRTQGDSSPERIEMMLNDRDMWKPSNVEKTLNATAETFQSAYKRLAEPNYLESIQQAYTSNKAAILKLQPKLKPVIDPVTKAVTKTNAFVGEQGAKVVAGYGSYYFVMGAIAAETCFEHNPENPLACENYLNSLTDAHGILMAGGFMAVSGMFMRRIAGFSTGATTLRTLPVFAAGLIVPLALQGVYQYATNPDVLACLNVLHPFSKRDMGACDRAYDLFSEENLGNTWTPVIVNMAATSLMFTAAQYAWTASGGAQWLRRFPLFSTARGNFTMSVLTTLAFAAIYQGADAGLKIQQRTREYELVHGTWTPNYYGRGIPQNETMLYKGWTTLKENNFYDLLPANVNIVSSPECQAAYAEALKLSILTGSIASTKLIPECITPESDRDFVGVLDRYAELQGNFRNLELARLSNAAQQWGQKVYAYHMSLDTSFKYYKQFIQAIQRERANPGMKSDDPTGFNSMVEHKMQDSLDQVMEATKKSPAPYVVDDTSKVWGGLNTDKYLDFLVASMACGPEAENYYVDAPDSYLRQAADFVSDYTPFSVRAHDRIVTNAPGMKARFFPPRLVKRVSGQDASVCERDQSFARTIKVFGTPTPDSFFVSSTDTSHLSLIKGLFTHGNSYPDLYKFVVANIRDEVLNQGTEGFEKWWKEQLSPVIVATEEQFRKEYQALMFKLFTPAMSSRDYYFCDVSNDADPALTQVMAKLTTGKNGNCAPAGVHRLPYGIINSMHEELRTYLSMFIDIEMTAAAKRGEDPAPEGQAYEDLANALLNKMDDTLLGMLTDDLFHFKPQGTQQKVNEVGADFKAFVDHSIAHHPELRGKIDCSNEHYISMAANLVCKMNGVFATTDQYIRILGAFAAEPDPALKKEAAQPAVAGAK